MKGVQRRQRIARQLDSAVAGEAVEITGWVRTSRFSKNVSFLEVSDGSDARNVQVVIKKDVFEDPKQHLGVGTAVRVNGSWVASRGDGQAFEIRAESVHVVGASDASTFPIQKKDTTMEYLRSVSHMRPRSNTQQSVVRVRNALSREIHAYFQDRGFLWIHTPLITASDAEGAGELFRVTSGGEDFFGVPTFLTVSGQLEVECFAQSHTDVYTFGPTFRAENSHTGRHAAEFWMIEPEIAFADLDDVIALGEDFVRTVTAAVMAACPTDFAFLDERISTGLIERLQKAVDTPFARITYADAQALLAEVDRKWEFPVGPGEALQAEHERYLAEEHFEGPVFVTNYPRSQKSFYMRLDDGHETVAATDLLVPGVGEMFGGSQREERLDELEQQFAFHDIPREHLEWYVDLRRWGSTPHGGFGLGLERMLMWITGMKNIRDVLPFPRTPGHIS